MSKYKLVIAGIVMMLVVVALIATRQIHEVGPNVDISSKFETNREDDSDQAAKFRSANMKLNEESAEQEQKELLKQQLTDKQKQSLQKLIDNFHKNSEMSRKFENKDAQEENSALEASKMYTPDRNGIRSAIQSKTPEIRECYEPWLQLNPNISGRIVTNFWIVAPENPKQKNAKIDGAKVTESGLGNKLLEGCIINVLSDLNFEKLQDGVIEVNYPFVFSQKDESSEASKK